MFPSRKHALEYEPDMLEYFVGAFQTSNYWRGITESSTSSPWTRWEDTPLLVRLIIVSELRLSFFDYWTSTGIKLSKDRKALSYIVSL